MSDQPQNPRVPEATPEPGGDEIPLADAARTSRFLLNALIVLVLAGGVTFAVEIARQKEMISALMEDVLDFLVICAVLMPLMYFGRRVFNTPGLRIVVGFFLACLFLNQILDLSSALRYFDNVPVLSGKSPVNRMLRNFFMFGGICAFIGCCYLFISELDAARRRLLRETAELNKEVRIRRDAQEALRSSEARFRAVFDNSPIGIVLSKEMRFVEVNYAFCAMTGYTTCELLDLTLRDITHPEDFAGDLENLEDLDSGKIQAFMKEKRYLKKNGKLLWTNTAGTLIRDESGKPMYGLAVVEDITVRRSAEEALLYKARFEELITTISTRFINLPSANIYDGMTQALEEIGKFMDLDRGFVLLLSDDESSVSCVSDWSREGSSSYREQFQQIPTSALTGWMDQMNRREPIVIDSIKEIPPEADLARKWFEAAGFRSLLEFPIVCSGRLIGMMGLGATREERMWLEDHVALLGTVAEIFGNSLDRGKMEEALRESEDRFRRAIENAPFPVMIHADNGEVLLISRAWRELTGYAREDIPTIADWTRLAHGVEDQLDPAEISRLYESDEPRSDGERLVATRAGTIRSWEFSSAALGRLRDGRRLVIRMAVDVTERNALEERLRHSQKMEAVGRLAGGVAHDFNNLLTAIAGYANLGKSNTSLPEPTRAHFSEIQKASDRAASLTRQLLAFSRRQTLKPAVVNLNQVLLNIRDMLRRLIGEDVELLFLPGKELWPVRVDPRQLEQVAINLAVNARDAMPRGGRLEVITENVHVHDDGRPGTGELPGGDYVLWTVADNGIGVSEEILPHLFEPFFTTKEPGKGTGLGLATCYGIIEQSGGHIAVASELGDGTTFRVYLPRVEGEPAAIPPPVEIRDLPRGRETILLVEDEPSVRGLAAMVLGELGYSVLQAADGEEALDVVHQNGGASLDLLLSDLVMPRMGGRELARLLMKEQPNLKVLFTSGYADEDVNGDIADGLKAAFLQKPFLPDTLARKVRRVLDS